MDLTLGRSKAVHFRSVEGSLQTSLKVGTDDELLIILNDLDNTPATRFASAALTSFFVGFKEEINREFLSAPLESGLYIRCLFVDLSQVPADVQAMLGDTREAPVSVAVPHRTVGQPHDIFIVCGPDLQERCQGDILRGTDLQLLYGDILRVLLTVALGGDIETDVLLPKLVKLIRKTI